MAVINLNNGRYEGDLNSSNEPNGYGICDYNNGDRYQGEWSNGKWSGFGKYYVNGKLTSRPHWFLLCGNHCHRPTKNN